MGALATAGGDAYMPPTQRPRLLQVLSVPLSDCPVYKTLPQAKV